MRNDEMRVSMYLLTICLPLATVLIVFAMKYISAALQARARLANDGLYQALVEKAVSAQVENQALLSAIRSELSQTTASLAAVEKLLRQVD